MRGKGGGAGGQLSGIFVEFIPEFLQVSLTTQKDVATIIWKLTNCDLLAYMKAIWHGPAVMNVSLNIAQLYNPKESLVCSGTDPVRWKSNK